MDAYLAVASKRDQREYAERPVPTDAVRRILDAGRIAGTPRIALTSYAAAWVCGSSPRARSSATLGCAPTAWAAGFPSR